MDTRQLFRTSKKMYVDLSETLEELEAVTDYSKIQRYEKCLMEIDCSIRHLKHITSTHLFPTIAEEVYFFREIKPLFVAHYMFYSKILALEASKPNAGRHVLQDYYEIELRNLRNFTNLYPDFYEYYRRNATYLDERYFVRHQFDLKMKLDAHLYNYDEGFTTAFDHQVATIICNDRLERYLLNSINELGGDFLEDSIPKPTFEWTGSKTGYVEIMYGLHLLRCFNNGNIELSEVIRFFSKALNIEIGNFYKILHEIKSRKTNRTKFLDLLRDTLSRHFDEEDKLA